MQLGGGGGSGRGEVPEDDRSSAVIEENNADVARLASQLAG